MTARDWIFLGGWIGTELAALALAAAVLEKFFRSAGTRRLVWQGTLTAMFFVLLVETTGLRALLPEKSATATRHWTYSVTTLDSPATAPSVKAAAPAASQEPTAKPAEVLVWPGLFWLTGTLLLLGKAFFARAALAIRCRSALPLDRAAALLIQRLREPLGLHGVHGQAWRGLHSPVAFGVFHPVIAVPADFAERFAPAAREAMVAHELAHLAARDPLWLLLGDIVRALAWWHPLVWWARRRWLAASECAADEASALAPGGACTLAECLVRMGRDLTRHEPAHLLGVGGTGAKSQLAVRVSRLLQGPRPWRRPSIWGRFAPGMAGLMVALAAAVAPGPLLPLMFAANTPDVPTPSSSATVAPSNNSPAISTATPLASTGPTNAPSPITAISSNAPSPMNFPGNHDGTTAAGFGTSLVKLNGPAPAGGSTPPPSRAPGKTLVTALSPISKSPKPTPRIRLRTEVVELTEAESERLGLDWLFGPSASNDTVVALSRDWNQFARPTNTILSPELLKLPTNGFKQASAWSSNLTVDQFSASGTAAVLQSNQFAALQARLRSAAQADILGMPVAITFSGRPCRLEASELRDIVAGAAVRNGSPTNQAEINYVSVPVFVGPMVELQPTHLDGSRWRLHVAATLVAFLGYDTPGLDTLEVRAFRSTRPFRGVLPKPHFRSLSTGAGGMADLGETMAIRGPLFTDTVKTKGGLFSRAKTQAVRKRIYYFVTLADPSGG